MKSFDESLERLANELATPSAARRKHRAAPVVTPSADAKPPARMVTPVAQARVQAADKAQAPNEVQAVARVQTKDEVPVPDKLQAAEKVHETEKSITPVVASTATERGRVDPHLVCLLEPRSEHAESYYRLRHVLETRRGDQSALVVSVTSPGQGDGKTLTGINLAGALAKDSRARVLLLDLDLRRRGDGLAECLGMKSSKDLGIVDWIRESGEGEEGFIHYLEPFNLHVMTAGSVPELPYELLKSSRLDDLIRRARERYDFIIIDTPQILRLPDTELISRLVDGFLIVVKADQTRQVKLEEALNLMTEDKVLGLVFNAVSDIE